MEAAAVLSFHERFSVKQQLMYSPCPWAPSFHYPTASVPVTASNCQSTTVPSSIARHPQTWSKEEVRIWLNWCSEEYAIESVSPDKFDMNGKALCLLSRKDIMDRDPQSGDILFNTLRQFLSRPDVPMYPVTPYPLRLQPNTSYTSSSSHSSQGYSDTSPNSVVLINAAQSTYQTPRTTSSYTPILPHPQTSLRPNISLDSSSAVPSNGVLSPAPTSTDTESAPSETDSALDDTEIDLQEVNTGNRIERFDYPVARYYDESMRLKAAGLLKKSEPDCRLLWEFIHQLLVDSKFKHLVCWENTNELVFRIVNPTGLAELWGHQKNRTNMTYEKLSRALRYYYKMNIIRKVPGKRLTYKFLQHPSTIRKGQRGARPHPKPSFNPLTQDDSFSKLNIPFPIPRLVMDQSPSKDRSIPSVPSSPLSRLSDNSPLSRIFDSSPLSSLHSNFADITVNSFGYPDVSKQTEPEQDEPEDLSVKREPSDRSPVNSIHSVDNDPLVTQFADPDHEQEIKIEVMS